MKKIVILLIAFTLLLGACGRKNKHKEQVIEKRNNPESAQIEKKITENEFINYYVQAAKIQKKYSDNPDSLLVKLASLHRQLGISDDDIKQFKESYTDRPKEWQLIWEEIKNRINNENFTGTMEKDL